MTSLAAFLLVAWAALFVQTVVNLLSFRALPAADPKRKDWPRVSVIIPARNEERDIGPTLDAVLAQDYPDLEVVVVDDGSEDRTAEEIQARSGDGRLRALSASPPPPGWLGKTNALATGAARAQGAWLLFMDADTRLRPSALRDAIGCAEREGWDHLFLIPDFERRGFWEELLMPSVLMAVFMILTPAFLAHFRKAKLAIGGGAFNLVRRRAYDAIDGHRRLANSVVDDMRLAMELKAAGSRSTTKVGIHRVRLRMYHGLGEIVDGFTKNAYAVFHGRELFLFVSMPLLLVLNLGPFVWLVLLAGAPIASSGSGTLLGLSLAFLLAAHALLQLRFHYALWPIFLTPLASVVGTFILLRSLRMAYGRGVVRWRGREYPRAMTRF